MTKSIIKTIPLFIVGKRKNFVVPATFSFMIPHHAENCGILHQRFHQDKPTIPLRKFCPIVYHVTAMNNKIWRFCVNCVCHFSCMDPIVPHPSAIAEDYVFEFLRVIAMTRKLKLQIITFFII